jgi:tRNA pseudouridine38-40 synthase
MRDAAACVVGRHDFSAFRAAECQARTPVRDLARCAIAAHGTLLRFDFSADGFLHHMIRNLVGAFVAIGNGSRDPAWIGELLASRDRTRGPATFAADGLYFTGADYDARFALPATRRDVEVLA